MAEFHANTKIQNQKIPLGEPNQRHLILLRKQKLLPLTTFFAVDENSPFYIDKKSGSVFYAESWALTHYLSLKDYVDRTSRIEEYTNLVGEKIDPVTAGNRAFGDLKKLEKSLNSCGASRVSSQQRKIGDTCPLEVIKELLLDAPQPAM